MYFTIVGDDILEPLVLSIISKTFEKPKWEFVYIKDTNFSIFHTRIVVSFNLYSAAAEYRARFAEKIALLVEWATLMSDTYPYTLKNTS